MFKDSKKSSDTGQAMTLLCLIVFLVTTNWFWLFTALIVLVVNMVCPIVFAPLAVVWFGLAELLGAVVSRGILTLIFFLLVLPFGLLRSLAGADPMRLKEWKRRPQQCNETNSNDSVFVERNHLYRLEDNVAPY